MSLVEGYIWERYGTMYGDPRLAARCYINGLKLNDRKIEWIENNKGFWTYELYGDALVIYDVYVAREERRQKFITKFFNSSMKELAKKNGKNVIITMSEKDGINREPGLNLMASVGFIKMSDLEDREMFIRGTN